jgi:hypothetical protein
MKVVFVAFAIEDKAARDLLRGQSLHTDCPFEYVDMSVKEPYDNGWKDRVRTRIRRSDGVIALVSKNTLTSTGEKWEIGCSIEEKRPLLGVWAYREDRTKPDVLAGKPLIAWSWDGIAAFISRL